MNREHRDQPEAAIGQDVRSIGTRGGRAKDPQRESWRRHGMRPLGGADTTPDIMRVSIVVEWVEFLREIGHDVVHVRELNMQRAADEVVADRARVESRRPHF